MPLRAPLAAAGFLALAGWAWPARLVAQHEGHGAEHPSETPPPLETAAVLVGSDMTVMTGMRPVDPMAGMDMPGWHLSDMGVGRLVGNFQGGPSGDSSLESSNWNMAHAQHAFAGGNLTFMWMASLEPATFPARGSPELFQTGEAYHGDPLVDRQHPHDFFMNLSATWRRPLGTDAAIWIQGAPVGEPALGPVAFMHRASAGDNPTAPIGHHWQDSTHIAFHVVTVGGGWRWLAVDASAFRGEEPDEHRWNIEGGRIDSASIRMRFLPEGPWSGQVSYGYLKDPEPLEPGSLHRTTASVSYAADGGGPFAATLVWGRNDEAAGPTESWLAEAAWLSGRRDQIFGRFELVEKDAVLLRTKRLPEEGAPREIALIGAWTLGYARELGLGLPKALSAGAGLDVTLYSFPRSLDTAYGSTPVSVHAFLRLRWTTGHDH
jgi:hypothetical protein